MKYENARSLTIDAAAIAGFVPLYGERETYEVRDLIGIDADGAWLTNCPTASLRGCVRIQRRSHADFVRRAKAIIAQKDELLAERARNCRVALGRD